MPYRTLHLSPRQGEHPHEWIARMIMQCEGIPAHATFLHSIEDMATLHWPDAEGGVAARGSVSPSLTEITEERDDGY